MSENEQFINHELENENGYEGDEDLKPCNFKP